MPLRRVALALALAMGSATASADPAAIAGRSMSVRDILEVKRVDQVAVSPDGRRVAFVVREITVSENRTVARVYWCWTLGNDVPRRLLEADGISTVTWL